MVSLRDNRESSLVAPGRRDPRATPREVEASELAHILSKRRGDARLVLLLDYDGTLSRIVAHPAMVGLENSMRRSLARAAARYAVYVISGRDCKDLRQRVAVEGVQYVGSHGLRMLETMPDIDRQGLADAAVELEAAANELEQWLDYIDGVVIERKTYCFALHYRMVDRHDLREINAAVADILERYGSVSATKGKQLIEFLPDIPWDKGRCVRALLARIDGEVADAANFFIFIGDDAADEGAFTVLDPSTAMTVLVADGPRNSAAEFCLRDVGAVGAFLARC